MRKLLLTIIIIIIIISTCKSFQRSLMKTENWIQCWGVVFAGNLFTSIIIIIIQSANADVKNSEGVKSYRKYFISEKRMSVGKEKKKERTECERKWRKRKREKDVCVPNL